MGQTKRPPEGGCADGIAKTLIWSCTEGGWYYDVDETILILEGSIALESDGKPPKRYDVG
jgi:uncharacterized cupin superfamily protein